MKKVTQFINKWDTKRIQDDGGYASKEYRMFEREYRTVLKAIAQESGLILHKFDPNHYEFSAVLKNEQSDNYYYVSISDVRYWENGWKDDILYRTMKHDKDWTGGRNHRSTLEDLNENLMMMKQKEQPANTMAFNELER